jgi:hypothetical protein
MTPKEKAKELVEKMIYNVNDNVTIKRCDVKIWQDTFKQCALIAVDEVLYCLNMNHDNVYFYNPEYEYYKEVKQEIEKL